LNDMWVDLFHLFSLLDKDSTAARDIYQRMVYIRV
jgi:hypothetical protein